MFKIFHIITAFLLCLILLSSSPSASVLAAHGELKARHNADEQHWNFWHWWKTLQSQQQQQQAQDENAIEKPHNVKAYAEVTTLHETITYTLQPPRQPLAIKPTDHVPVVAAKIRTSTSTSKAPRKTGKVTTRTTAKTTSTKKASSTTTKKPATTSTSKRTSSTSSKTTSSAGSTATGGSGGAPAGFASDILKAHNSARTARGAKALTWSTGAVAAAKAWGDKCVWKHGGADGMGQNLAASAGYKQSGQQVVDAWMSEEKDYNPSNPTYSHFTQVVWKSTTAVGCYQATCNKLFNADGSETFPGFSPSYFTVCNYSPPGNYAGQYASNVQKLS